MRKQCEFRSAHVSMRVMQHSSSCYNRRSYPGENCYSNAAPDAPLRERRIRIDYSHRNYLRQRFS